MVRLQVTRSLKVTHKYRARCPLLQVDIFDSQIVECLAIYFVVVPPVTVNDFVDRSEEFFGKKLKQGAIRKRLDKYKDFKVDNYQIIPLEESDEDSEEE